MLERSPRDRSYVRNGAAFLVRRLMRIRWIRTAIVDCKGCRWILVSDEMCDKLLQRILIVPIVEGRRTPRCNRSYVRTAPVPFLLRCLIRQGVHQKRQNYFNTLLQSSEEELGVRVRKEQDGREIRMGGAWVAAGCCFHASLTHLPVSSLVPDSLPVDTFILMRSQIFAVKHFNLILMLI